jgi:hypothetical protein
LDVRLVGRNLESNDGRFVNKKFFGYGGGLSGDVKPGCFGWAKDDLQWQFTVGNGICRYLSDSTNAGANDELHSCPDNDCSSRQRDCQADYRNWRDPRPPALAAA